MGWNFCERVKIKRMFLLDFSYYDVLFYIVFFDIWIEIFEI